jgi:hypothetical protein
MTVIERERVPTRPERAIFVASDGRRARILRRASLAVALLACLWAVGLGLGMLGFGSLPGVSVVKEQIDGIGGSGARAPLSRPTDEVSPVVDRSTPAEQHRVSAAQATPARSARTPARTRPVRSRPAARPVRAAPAPPAAQVPVNPATRERGWSRRGSTAPPGQVRKTVTPPPPATRGQHRGQDPTAPPPVAPGQEKKALLPPPPPPPKKA